MQSKLIPMNQLWSCVHSGFQWCHWGTEKLNLLLDEWISCAGEWKKSTLYKRFMERSTTSSHGARVWLTKAQIEAKYKSAAIAESIVRAKLDDPEARETSTKAHPDCPDNEAQSGLETRVHIEQNLCRLSAWQGSTVFQPPPKNKADTW